MIRSRLLGAFLFLMGITVSAAPVAATGKVTNATSAKHAPIIAAQVGSRSGVQNAASEELPLLGLGTALILGAVIMRRLASVRMK